jgi:polyketide biosynthesis acyl carrier protein
LYWRGKSDELNTKGYPSMSKKEIFEILKKNIIEVIEDVSPDAISIKGRLKDLGANSVDRMEIVTLTMEELDICVPVQKFAGIKDIKGLVDILYQTKK